MWKKTKEMKWKTAKLLWGDLFYDIAGAVLFAAGVYTFAENADQRYFINLFFFQRFHRKNNHPFSDSVTSVIFIYTDMIQTPPSSVVTAQNTSDNATVFFCHDTCRRVSFQKARHSFF